MARFFGASFDRVAAFAELLAQEGEVRGLIGPRELPRLWSRHVVNSAAVGTLLDDARSMADVGSGAGLPGMVLALMRPDLPVTLVEPMERRVDWLRYVADRLPVDNVEVVRSRAEQLHGVRTFDVVTARAVAALDRLGRWTVPLLAERGRLLALKGERAEEEVAGATATLRKMRVRNMGVREIVPFRGAETVRVVVVER